MAQNEMQHENMEELDRKELVLDLLKGLQRNHLCDIHAVLTERLRRDVIGCLPRELALYIFSYLDIPSLLEASLVNKTWQALANDQVLWHRLCENDAISANSLTSWRDIFAEREKVIRIEKEDAERKTHSKEQDDSWDETSDLDDQIPDAIFSGIRRDVIERTDFSLPSVDPSSRRRPSFRSGRQQSGLPIFLLPTGSSSSGSHPAPQRPTTNFPVLSHLPAPFPRPQCNYKHLYLVHKILKARFMKGKQRPTVLDAAASVLNGGLDGHREGIYCLQIINQELVIPIEPTSKSMSSPRRSGSIDGASAITSIEGRNWLFSGSRDRTIRLWDLQSSRVVKVYQASPDQGGHEGSVLTLHVRAQGAGKGMRLISGGSDGKLVIWDVATGAIEGQIQAHERLESVLCVRFDDKRIVCCSKDRSIRTWDAKTLEPLLIIGGPSPNVGVQAENHLLQADIPHPNELEGHRAAVNAVALVKDLIISASGDRTLRIWCANTGKELTRINAHTGGIASLDVDESTGTIVTGSSDTGIRIYQLSEWGFDFTKPSAGCQIHPTPGTGIPQIPHPSGQEFFACRYCRSNESNRSHMPMHDLHTDAAQAGEGGQVALRCMVCYNRSHKGLVRSLWLGGDIVCSGSYDMTIKLWDRKGRVFLADLPGLHTSRIFSVIGDRTKIVSTGIDQRIIIWDFGYGLDTSFVNM